MFFWLKTCKAPSSFNGKRRGGFAGTTLPILFLMLITPLYPCEDSMADRVTLSQLLSVTLAT